MFFHKPPDSPAFEKTNEIILNLALETLFNLDIFCYLGAICFSFEEENDFYSNRKQQWVFLIP